MSETDNKIQLTEEVLVSMGFYKTPAAEFKKLNPESIAAADGDDIWQHNKLDGHWAQGRPFASTLVERIFSFGILKGLLNHERNKQQ